jgi:Asp-tRNA(Asn)/Glu-tRNA(Gln) amidotransferase A subunit family amidase
MTDNDKSYISATKAMAAFAAKRLSPVELMKDSIDRAKSAHSAFNCFTETYYDAAIELAKKAEDRWQKGTARRLEGIPLAVKEEFRLKGSLHTSSSLLFADRIDDETDVYIQRLLDEGAIPIAKTTTPEFCIEGTTHSRLWGITRNPWNPEFTPGGSSGGSGVALATGVVPLATGTDIGGSIRIPASACGVVGYKPPYGRNPEIEVFNLDYYSHSGPMARTVADCALMQNITSGQHVSDIASLREKIELGLDAPANLKGWRIAWSIDFGFYNIDNDVRANTIAALDLFRELGAEVVEVDLEWTRDHALASEDHLLHLCGAGLVGLLEEHRDLLNDYTIAFAEASLKSTAEQFLKADVAVIEMYRTFGQVMERFDVFICPTLSVPAPPADSNQVNRRIIHNGIEIKMLPEEWQITRLFNMLSRCPVLNVPSGFASNGVPTGIQIVGRPYWDEKVFDAAMAFEQAKPWFADASNRPNF